MSLTRTPRRALAPLAAIGLAVALGGCGSDPAESDAGCEDVRAAAADLAEEITTLGAEVEAGSAPDDGTLQEREQEWAELVLGDRRCFSAERVAVALTVLQPPAG